MKNIKGLPKYSSILDSELFHPIRNVIVETGRKDKSLGGAIVIKRKAYTLFTFPDEHENAESILKFEHNGLAQCFICSHAKEEASRTFVEVTGQNLVAFFTGAVSSGIAENKLVAEIVAGCGMLTQAEKDAALAYAKKEVKKFRGETVRENVIQFPGAH
jgi:hypothetical protein